MAATFAIAVHGGAGRWTATDLPLANAACEQAAQSGWKILRDGGTAIDAITTAIMALEDEPLFNAGTGSCLNQRGEIEMDAAIMDGTTLAAGAAAGIQHYKNPIAIARQVMHDGRHVLLAGEGAEQFAQARGLPRIDSNLLIVPKRAQQWHAKHGTVGAVALDKSGQLAAGTSTGGLFDKLPGRISDSALIGCGTYADTFAAVSCTGIGEAIIRAVLAKSAVVLIQNGCNAIEAAQRAIAEFTAQTQSEAGLILIDKHGAIGIAHNAAAMAHFSITSASV
jgi:L-asparaginase / beta-aspartyl-peptidase